MLVIFEKFPYLASISVTRNSSTTSYNFVSRRIAFISRFALGSRSLYQFILTFRWYRPFGAIPLLVKIAIKLLDASCGSYRLV